MSGLYLVTDVADIGHLEARLYNHFHARSELMNGTRPAKPPRGVVPKPTRCVQVMPNREIAEKKDVAQRLPRQAAHYAQIVGHFVAVKNSKQIARAMQAHFERLRRYHGTLLRIATDQPDEESEGD